MDVLSCLTGTKAPSRKRDDDILFDDDDVLGGMGLDSPRQASTKVMVCVHNKLQDSGAKWI